MINVADEEVINAEENPEILSLIQQYEGANDEVLSKVIGNTATELDGARPNVRTKETNLADLITDSMRLATGADAVITNGGGIRASIDAGEITMAEALEVLPFGNLVTVIEATGQDIVDALKHGASDYPEPKGAFPQVSGLEYTIDISSGSVEIKDVKINGEDIQLEKTYTLATNDFMAVGGDDYKMFEGSKQVSLHGSILEIFANYLTELSKDGAFTATTDGRIKVVTEIEEPEDTQEPGDTEKPKDKDKPADTKKPAEDNTKTQKNTNVNTSRNTNNNKARKNSPNTGDKSLVIPVVVLAIALGGLVVINNKKEKVR